MDKTKRQGVRPRSGKIEIDFRLADGTRRRELLDTPYTPKNEAYAIRLRAEIEDKIRLGIFNYADYFPNSRYAKREEAAHTKTVAQAADEWLTIRAPEIQQTTLMEYRKALSKHFLDDLGDTLLSDLTYPALKLHIAGLGLKPKTFNNVTGPIRGVLEYAYKAGYTKQDFSADIHCLRKDTKPEPDPLSPDEVDAVLAYMADKYPEPIYSYFEFAIFSGLRPSEMLTLAWPHIDMRRGIARVQSAKVRGILKGTKTGPARDVELHDRALAALLRQKPHTFMSGKEVFLNPITGNPYYDSDVQVRVYWKPALKALGIRSRDARQTRHTCATMMLMAECKPAWAASQLGHSTEMFFRVYSKWIEGADKGEQRKRFSSFGHNSVTKKKQT